MKGPAAEIHEEAQWQFEQLQVGQHLPRMDGGEPIDRFDLDDQSILDK
jgi:hypothetical protein